MLGVDKKLKQKEERALKRSEMQTARKKRIYEEMEQNFDSRQFATSEQDVSGDDSESSSVVDQETSASTISTTTSATSPATRGTLQFFTPILSQVFDRCKITDRNGVYILIAAADAFGRDTENLVINQTSFQRLRKNFTEERHSEKHQKFNLSDCQELVLHWDGSCSQISQAFERLIDWQ